MFGNFKGHRHGGHHHLQRHGSKDGGGHHHSRARFGGHAHFHRWNRWSGFNAQTQSGDDQIFATQKDSAAAQVMEMKPASGVSACPFCEKQCLLDDPGCGKGEAYARSLNSSAGGLS